MFFLFILDHDNWPTFKTVSCNTFTQEGNYSRCYEVNFPGDRGKDYMLLEEVPNAFKTFEGILKEDMVPVAFNDPDVDDGETKAGVRIFDNCKIAIKIK